MTGAVASAPLSHRRRRAWEASGEPKKGARAVTWLPYRCAAVRCERDWTMTTMEDDAVKASLKAGW